MRNYDQKRLVFTAEGQTFSFTAYTNDLRDGYIEHVTMHDPFTCDLYHGSNRVWNRPWQSYAYQSACLSAIAEAIEEEKESLVSSWKAAHDYARMTAKRREDYNNSPACTSDRLKALHTLHWRVSDRISERVLGYRERGIMRDVVNTVKLEDTAEHIVYRMFDNSGNYFDWDQMTRSVVG